MTELLFFGAFGPTQASIGRLDLVFCFFFSLLLGFFLLDRALALPMASSAFVFAIVCSSLLFLGPLIFLVLFFQNMGAAYIPTNSVFFMLVGSVDSMSLLFVFMVHLVCYMVLFFLFIYSLPCVNAQALTALRVQVAAVFIMTVLLDVLFMSTSFVVMFFAAEFSLFPLSFLLLKDSTIFWRSPRSVDTTFSLSFLERRFENKRPLAFYYLVLFTVISGGLGLIGFSIFYLVFGDLSFPLLSDPSTVAGLVSLQELSNTTAYSVHAACLFILLWVAVKVPLVPVHIWLPKAHVEGSTESSMLLAGIILKITTYVLIRLSSLFFFQWFFIPIEGFFITLALVTALFGAFGALATTDLKKLAAYSSVSHMGIILVSGFLLGFSSFAIQPYLILLMTHTIISTALFMIIGCVYKMRNKNFISRNRLVYGGLLYCYPFLFLFGLILFANLNIPLTLGFLGELGVFVSAVQLGSSVVVLLLFGSFILLLPMMMVLAQVLMGPFRGSDFVFNQLVSSGASTTIHLYGSMRVFDHLGFAKNYMLAYDRLRLFLISIATTVIGFGLFPLIFARFCGTVTVGSPFFL